MYSAVHTPVRKSFLFEYWLVGLIQPILLIRRAINYYTDL